MKTEREKMLSNELYNASDDELMKRRAYARDLVYEYNLTRQDESRKRNEILHKLFGEISGKIFIEPSFRCDYGNNIYCGDNVYMNFNCIILDCAKVTIGSNVMFAPNVQIYTAYHPVDPIARATSPLELAAPITIGNNVWIGGGAIICPGVTIGDNSVIGAGSVVTKDIPSNVVAVGNPCRVIKTFDEETIDELEKMKLF